VIVTIDGQPSFELLPVRSDGDPEFVNRLLEESEEFRLLMEARKSEADEGRVSSLEEVRARLLE
jgi:hypothetical protein